MPGFIAAGAIKALGITSAVGKFVVNVAAAVLFETVSSKLFGPKVPGRVGLQGRDVTVRSALEYRKVVYGQASVSGPIAYVNKSGSTGQYLWYVIPLCWGESEDLVSVRLDQDVIPKSDIAWTAGTGGADGTGDGDVSTAKFVANAVNAVSIRYYLGDPDQVVSGALNTEFTDVNANFRLREITYMIVRITYTEDTEEVWDLGFPQNYRAVIKGRKIYDPRLDSTNGGTGSHRYTDSSTWEWSDNPALCLADYLMTYMEVDAATRIDWTAVSDAADDCDVLVAIPTASTQKRFTCNGAISMGETNRQNIEAIMSSMAGSLSYTAGKWVMRAGVWATPDVSLTEDDFFGETPLTVRTLADRDEVFNTVRGYFIDPDRKYIPSEFPQVTASEFVTRDNGETIEYDLQLPMTNDNYTAQRIAYRLLEQGDNQILAECKLNPVGFKLAAGGTVNLTVDRLSWSPKTFRVVNWKLNEDLSVTALLKEDQAASYTDPVEGDYSTVGAGGVITLPSDVTPPPTGLTATAVEAGIRLEWTNPAARSFEWIDVYESATSAWSGASKIAEVRGNTFDRTLAAGTERWFWIRARSFDNIESARLPDSDTSTINATAGKAFTIEKNAVSDGQRTFPGGVSGSSTDTTWDVTGATLAYTNNLAETIDVEVSYKGLFGLSASPISGFGYWAWLEVTGDVTFSEGNSSFRLNGYVDPDYNSRSGSTILTLAANDAITARVRIRMFSPAGTYPTIPDIDWLDVELIIKPQSR